MDDQANIHSTGFVFSGVGILMRGPSGSGKSTLALSFLRDAELSGQKAALVADDRIDLVAERGKLIMKAPPSIGGMIELRGRGIVSRPHVDKAEVNLVVDLVEDMVRLIEEDQLSTKLMGITIARCPVPERERLGLLHQKLLIEEAIRALAPAKPVRRKKSA